MALVFPGFQPRYTCATSPSTRLGLCAADLTTLLCIDATAPCAVVTPHCSLQAENKELARQAVTGRHGQLQCEIALYQRHNADLKTELQRMEAYCERLDAEVAEMQRRIVTLRKGEGASA